MKKKNLLRYFQKSLKTGCPKNLKLGHNNLSNFGEFDLKFAFGLWHYQNNEKKKYSKQQILNLLLIFLDLKYRDPYSLFLYKGEIYQVCSNLQIEGLFIKCNLKILSKFIFPSVYLNGNDLRKQWYYSFNNSIPNFLYFQQEFL